MTVENYALLAVAVVLYVLVGHYVWRSADPEKRPPWLFALIIGAPVLLFFLLRYTYRGGVLTLPPASPPHTIDTTEAEEVLDELDAPVPDLDPNDPTDVARVADALLGGALHGGAKRTEGVPKRAFRLEGRGVLTGGLSHPSMEARGGGGDQGGEASEVPGGPEEPG